MVAPKLVVISVHTLQKPPDKRVEREVIFFACYDVFYVIIHTLENKHGGWTRSAEGQVAMNFVKKDLYFKTI